MSKRPPSRIRGREVGARLCFEMPPDTDPATAARFVRSALERYQREHPGVLPVRGKLKPGEVAMHVAAYALALRQAWAEIRSARGLRRRALLCHALGLPEEPDPEMLKRSRFARLWREIDALTDRLPPGPNGPERVALSTFAALRDVSVRTLERERRRPNIRKRWGSVGGR